MPCYGKGNVSVEVDVGRVWEQRTDRHAFPGASRRLCLKGAIAGLGPAFRGPTVRSGSCKLVFCAPCCCVHKAPAHHPLLNVHIMLLWNSFLRSTYLNRAYPGAAGAAAALLLAAAPANAGVVFESQPQVKNFAAEPAKKAPKEKQPKQAGSAGECSQQWAPAPPRPRELFLGSVL